MFLNYFPVASRIKQVGIWGWLVLVGCPSPWAGESWEPGEHSLLCAPAPPQGCLWILPAEETCSSSLSFPCQESKGMFDDGLVCYFDDVWSIFLTWKGEKEKVKLLVEDTSPPSDHSAFIFAFPNFSFHEFPSALFACLFYMQTTSMPLWTCDLSTAEHLM